MLFDVIKKYVPRVFGCHLTRRCRFLFATITVRPYTRSQALIRPEIFGAGGTETESMPTKYVYNPARRRKQDRTNLGVGVQQGIAVPPRARVSLAQQINFRSGPWP